MITQTLTEEEQHIVLEMVFNDPSVFFTVLPVLQPIYFDAPNDVIIQFVLDFYAEYKALPDVKFINSKFGSNFGYVTVQPHEFTYLTNVIEKHCQLRAFVRLFERNADAYHAGNIDINSVWREFQELNSITVQKDIGLEQFKDPAERLKLMQARIDMRPTGYPKLDAMFSGGLQRGEMLIVAGGTGDGKSLMLANIAYNFSLQKLNGVIVSLELNQDLIGKRLDSIVTGIEPRAVFDNIDKIVAEYQRIQGTVGSIIIKKLRNGATANNVRNYILEYYMQFKRYPDFFCLDYLDLMSPMQRHRNDGAFDRDKAITEEVRDVIDEFNMYGITASQLNRDAIGVISPNVSHIAGGLSKVNTSDITIAITNASEDENIDTGERAIHLLKIRNGKKHPMPFSLWLDDSLRLREDGQRIVLPKHTNIFQRGKNDLTTSLKEKLNN